MNAELFATSYRSGADFSDCGCYRYRLWRAWDANLPVLGMCLMNPSLANDIADDPTIDRQVRRAQMLGYGALEVVNVFALVEQDSTKLAGRVAHGADIVGPLNDGWILRVALQCGALICGWGVPGHHLLNRGPLVLGMLSRHNILPYALGINADGSPKHPLYVRYNAVPIPF